MIRISFIIPNEHTLSISITRYLYRDDLMPKNTKIIGYARSDLTVDKLRAKIEPFMKVSVMIKHIFQRGLLTGWGLCTQIKSQS